MDFVLLGKNIEITLAIEKVVEVVIARAVLTVGLDNGSRWVVTH